MRNIEFISAGAGSGKTTSLTQRLKDFLENQGVQPEGIIATTFTRLAATELRERVRQALLKAGRNDLANSMGLAAINTVNGVCGQLLKRFAFEAGLSPEQRVLDEPEAKQLFGEALDTVIDATPDRVRTLNQLARRLGHEDGGKPLWRRYVIELVSAARANDCNDSQLVQFSQLSREELLSFFRKPTDRDLDQELLQQIEGALETIDTAADTTKATRDYLLLLKQTKRSLTSGQLSWDQWVKMSKTSPGAKSRAAAEGVQLVAEDFEVHPRLHQDLNEYIDLVFQLAEISLETYQTTKRQQGLLDFVDQELLLFRLLESPTIQAVLEDELQLLMVDEFQDTSPIQLALFLRLAKLADHVVWVGDVKQAIYGFRGSDPALMQRVLSAVLSGGGQTGILEKSWRSRPALVHYCNAIFSHAFQNTVPAKQVCLEPARKEQVDEPAIVRWSLSGNIDNQLAALASGIRNLLVERYQVIDKETGEPRNVRPGDIAVLCRSNDRLKVLAQACAVQGLDVSYTRPGLLATPECTLAIACLRRVSDRNDSLATAEIRMLAMGESVPEWLPERLNYVADEASECIWGEDGTNDILTSLADVRTHLRNLTPSESLAEALQRGKVRETVNRWGPTRQRVRSRHANLDALQGLAEQYESHCKIRSEAANVSGLILWLKMLEKEGEDWQATRQDDDVLTLVTYHGAKGLEWPVVIAFDQDYPIKTRLWGVSVRGSAEDVDILEPLAHRVLRFWPYPFGKQAKDIPVVERIQAAESGQQAEFEALEEEKRLQYVTFTRARDLLILPVKDERRAQVPSTLGVEWVYPHDNCLLLPDGASLPARQVSIEPLEDRQALADIYQPLWMHTDLQTGVLLSRSVTASAMEPRFDATIGEIVELGERLPLTGKVEDIARLGTAIHNSIAADTNAGESLTLDRVDEILVEWGVRDAIAPESAIEASRRLRRAICDRYQVVSWLVEYPVSYVTELGQEMTGFIDLLVETPEGWLIIDHKSSPARRSEWQGIALGYSGQLALYEQAISELTFKPVLGCWIHFAITGGLVEVRT
ncbi:hypothetical protein A8C75_08975 [Marinobacterium aestuarii]|uniref:DNA 3'-5' helicase n=1 Tax=Marinobacterium aestuarii TaxID=1821621 RepID=A0A1A9EXR3_9GAMM|nr:UvrD-helicase domain-containing protein [Marinobacterium aestuarii]ANG62602.1 hypothetical protein A8C75_08975 [Marinobacterium aestuarii]